MRTLIDTSAWIHQMRPSGDPQIRARVEALLMAGEAVWCPMVRLELWNGVRDDKERKALDAYADVLPELPISSDVWALAYEWSSRCRRAGKTVPAIDTLIFCCARTHNVEILHADAHFELLASLA
jgi:predicted nucleic acid-binding protein